MRNTKRTPAGDALTDLILDLFRLTAECLPPETGWSPSLA